MTPDEVSPPLGPVTTRCTLTCGSCGLRLSARSAEALEAAQRDHIAFTHGLAYATVTRRTVYELPNKATP